jgi:hypothetical protein
MTLRLKKIHIKKKKKLTLAITSVSKIKLDEGSTLHGWMEAAIESSKTNTLQFDVEGK